MRTAESVVLTDWPPGPGGAVDVDLQVLVLDVDVDLLGLGQDGHRRRRGVHPALRLGDRHPLHPVRPSLVLEMGPGRVALDQEGHLVEPAHVRGVGREDLDAEALALGVADVHLVEVPGEEVGLLAALGAADLDDHVLAVVGVLGQQQKLSSSSSSSMRVLGSLDLPLEHLALAPGQRRPASPWPRRGPPSAAAILPVGADDRLEVPVAPGHLPELACRRPHRGRRAG